MGTGPIEALGAAALIERLRQGSLTAEALVRACLDRIARDEPRIHAWAWLDPEQALATAAAIDAGGRRAPLFGLPVGVKDIIDTADMPTECGSSLRRGRRPAADAACVAALRAAGAVVLGKTVTTEFAYFSPGKTRNPRNPEHTPGGSSSGSAAAVAASMVPAALGSQTAGSVIRPAAFCGVVGMKPTHGLLALDGVSPLAPSLDTLGVFARHVEDLPVLLEALGAPLEPEPSRSSPPRIGICHTEAWRHTERDQREAVRQAAVRLREAGAAVDELELGAEFEGLFEAQQAIMSAEMWLSLGEERRSHGAAMSGKLRTAIDEGAALPPMRYAEALALADDCERLLPGIFAKADVLLTASAVGEAPATLESTGDPAMNRIWTLLHVPCISVPFGAGSTGLPLGVQLVGPLRGDAQLIADAAWVAERLRQV